MSDSDDTELRVAQRAAEQALDTLKRSSHVRAVRERAPACSFCGKDKTQAKVLIAGDRGYICDACVEVCRGLIATERGVAGE